MAVKVAINGFGRIGRLAFRQMFGAEGYEVVAFTLRLTLRNFLGEKSVLMLFLSVQVSIHLRRRLQLILRQVPERLLFQLQHEMTFLQSFTT